MEQKEQIGTLVVTERAVRTTYPVYDASFGILSYTDITQVWFSVSAGTAISNPDFDSRQPRMITTVSVDELDPQYLAHAEFEIPIPLKKKTPEHTDSLFYYVDHPGVPKHFSSGHIQFQHAVENGYQVCWTATLDAYDGPAEPGSQIEIELNAIFHPKEIEEYTCTQKESLRTPKPWPFLFIIPLFAIFAVLKTNFPQFGNLWIGLFIAGFFGILLATFIYLYRQDKLVRRNNRKTADRN